MKDAKEKYPLFIKTLIATCLLLMALMILTCGTTAVKGIPVKELFATKPELAEMKKTKETEKLELAKMSNVTENSVFETIDGIPQYRIGPLDILEINSRVGEKSTTTLVTVNGLGKINYSFLDNLKVGGITPTQLDTLLTKELSAYIRKPRIDVMVKEYRSKSALALGEFSLLRSGIQTGSGQIFLKGKTTLMDFIALAHGYTVKGDIRRLKLIRKGKTYVINIYDIIAQGNENLNVIIDTGDTVDIPELPEVGEKVFVMGEVEDQGVYDLKDAEDLLSAIALAGKFTDEAKEENTLIVRATEPGKKPLVMMANVEALLERADLSQNIKLRDGDLVYVPRMVIGDINKWIRNLDPLMDWIFWSKYNDIVEARPF
ncbi:MAG: polysaccharide biosynthesis/export family protein [Deltaproteobacteria bacterium]|uniref:Polysaccharide biosynthesis/export family protein n=1 Tax=Candidatus Desulfacyla euxinica TaxID=2841693 RepID=A0A8J6T6Q8_9DELT|nr:polysaccharide biosynthesis/export family protein [Candidatus Desulfacyla euxinica]